MTYDDLLYNADEGIATITFDRPQVLNAASDHTHDELVDALDRADDDDDVRAVIITGTGRAFCSGTDLTTGASWSMRPGDPSTGKGVPPDGAARGPLRIYDMRKPVIGAINGVAAGFGASLLCALDIRVASDAARVGFVYARRGICTESCSSYFLPRIVGLSRAIEWVATGRMVAADELLATGFVHSVVSPQNLIPTVRRLGREIAESAAPAAVAVSRHLLRRNSEATHPREASRFEARGLTGLMALDDPAEGKRAFLEKDAPRFRSRVSRDVEFLASW